MALSNNNNAKEIKVLIIGNFGYKKNQIDGQTIKTSKQ